MVELKMHEAEFLMIVSYWMSRTWKEGRVPFTDFARQFEAVFNMQVPDCVSHAFGDYEHIADYDELQILVE